MAESERRAKEVLVQVCIECGTEYLIEEGEAAREEPCGKCGNTVYRSFRALAGSDEVTDDFRDATERDTATDDGPTDVTSGDLHDLERF
jgi:hypothetical protein